MGGDDGGDLGRAGVEPIRRLQPYQPFRGGLFGLISGKLKSYERLQSFVIYLVHCRFAQR